MPVPAPTEGHEVNLLHLDLQCMSLLPERGRYLDSEQGKYLLDKIRGSYMAAGYNFFYWHELYFYNWAGGSLHLGLQLFHWFLSQLYTATAITTWLEHRVWCAVGWVNSHEPLPSHCNPMKVAGVQCARGRVTLMWLLLRTIDTVVSAFLVPFAHYTASHSHDYCIKRQSRMHMPYAKFALGSTAVPTLKSHWLHYTIYKQTRNRL